MSFMLYIVCIGVMVGVLGGAVHYVSWDDHRQAERVWEETAACRVWQTLMRDPNVILVPSALRPTPSEDVDGGR